jgi:hypothetical protein
MQRYCIQVVLPASLKTTFLELVHADTAGHLKVAKTIEHVRRRAWWYNWRTNVRLFVAACNKCAMYYRGPTPRQGYLRPMVLGYPAQRLNIDLTGPYPTSVDGYIYMFTAICPFSKYAIEVPVRNKEASNVAKALVDNVFFKWGMCEEVLTDQGKKFEAELLQEFLSLLGVTRLRTSGYAPATNGSIERWHRVLNSILAKLIAENQKDWNRLVNYAVFCYNATVHSATSFSPFFLMTGREPNWNIDMILDNPDLNVNQDTHTYAWQVYERLIKVNDVVCAKLQINAG